MIKSPISGAHLLLGWITCAYLMTVSINLAYGEAHFGCEYIRENIPKMPEQHENRDEQDEQDGQDEQDEYGLYLENRRNSYEPSYVAPLTTTNNPIPVRMEVSCSNINYSSIDPVYDCGSCWKLSFKDSVISVVTTNVHQHVTNLEELDLARTSIQKIEPGGFAHLPSLRYLHLGGNRLTKIGNGVFNSLVNLQFLNLSHNNISQIDGEAFHGSQEIQILDLSFNNISSIPIVFKDNKLRILNVSNNLLTNIDELFCQSRFILTEVILNNNLLNKVPTCMNETLVQILSLSFNLITSLNSTDLPLDLEELFISNNQIHHINEDFFRSLRFLTTLDISNTFWDKFPYDSFKNIYELLSLDISSTNMKSIDFQLFTFMKTLKSLSLSKNGISSLQKGVFQALSNLTHLDLSRNNITLLQQGVLTDLRSLEILNLSHNEIEYLQAGIFNGMNMLQVLDLSSNNMKFFRFHLLRPLRVLRVLNISYNQFVSLDVDFKSPVIRVLISIDGNNFSCNSLVKIISKLELSRFHVQTGKTVFSENIDGISCGGYDGSTDTEDAMADMRYFFGNGFKNTSFYEFFKNFPTRKTDVAGRNLNKVLEYLSENFTINVSNSLNNHVKDFMKFENTSFQDFFRRLENTSRNNETKSLDNLSSSLQNEIQSFVNLEKSSFDIFMDKLSKIVDRVEEGRNESKRIPEMIDTLQEMKAERLTSSKETNDMAALIAAINQQKFFMILCTFVVVLLVVGIKVFPLAKNGYFSDRFHEQNHEMPMLS